MTHHHEDSIDPRLLAAAQEGCPESRLLISRRSLIGLSAGFFASSLIPRTALSAATDKRLLIVLLRGGMDGLHVALPVTDTEFQTQRKPMLENMVEVRNPSTAKNAPAKINVKFNKTLLSLNDPAGQQITDYKLHPALTTFAGMFNSNEGAIVHAIAPPLRNRSHFQCQFNLESGYGQENPVSFDGWLNRLLLTPEMAGVDRVSSSTYKAVAGGPMPFILTGQAPVNSWQIDGLEAYLLPPRAQSALLNYYQTHDRPHKNLLERGIATVAKATAPDTTGASLIDLANLPDTTARPVRHLFRGAARMMREDGGPRVAVVAIEGWDTHNTEAVPAALHGRLRTLDGGLEDFKAEMGTLWNNTVVVCVSEFGRTIELNSQNAAGCGTEHGQGTVALLAGGGLRRGGFYGEMKRSVTEQLKLGSAEGQFFGRHEIEPTMDTRQLFARVLEGHMGIERATVNSLFPGFSRTTMLGGLFNDG